MGGGSLHGGQDLNSNSDRQLSQHMPMMTGPPQRSISQPQMMSRQALQLQQVYQQQQQQPQQTVPARSMSIGGRIVPTQQQYDQPASMSSRQLQQEPGPLPHPAQSFQMQRQQLLAGTTGMMQQQQQPHQQQQQQEGNKHSESYNNNNGGNQNQVQDELAFSDDIFEPRPLADPQPNIPTSNEPELVPVRSLKQTMEQGRPRQVVKRSNSDDDSLEGDFYSGVKNHSSGNVAQQNNAYSESGHMSAISMISIAPESIDERVPEEEGDELSKMFNSSLKLGRMNPTSSKKGDNNVMDMSVATFSEVGEDMSMGHFMDSSQANMSFSNVFE
jgi:hypothetical protein